MLNTYTHRCHTLNALCYLVEAFGHFSSHTHTHTRRYTHSTRIESTFTITSGTSLWQRASRFTRLPSFYTIYLSLSLSLYNPLSFSVPLHVCIRAFACVVRLALQRQYCNFYSTFRRQDMPQRRATPMQKDEVKLNDRFPLNKVKLRAKYVCTYIYRCCRCRQSQSRIRTLESG